MSPQKKPNITEVYFSSVPPRKYRYSTWKQSTTEYFHIPYSSSVRYPPNPSCRLIPLIITQSFLRQVHSLFQIEFSVTSFNFQYLPFPLSSSSSCLRLLPHLHVTSLPSVTCFRRQFLRKMWPIQSAFLLFIKCKIFLSFFTLCKFHYVIV
jgi:hypothetical protein